MSRAVREPVQRPRCACDSIRQPRKIGKPPFPQIPSMYLTVDGYRNLTSLNCAIYGILIRISEYSVSILRNGCVKLKQIRSIRLQYTTIRSLLALPARVHHLHGEMISSPPCWVVRLFSSTYVRMDRSESSETFLVTSRPNCSTGTRIWFGSASALQSFSFHSVEIALLISARISSAVLSAQWALPPAPF